MDATELYQPILGLTEPWYVETVTVDEPTTTVTIQLAHQTGSDLFQCAHCRQNTSIYDHLPERTWRHLDTCQYTTLVQACVPRVACPRCGVHTVRVPWAEPKARFTALFESHVIDVLLTAQVQSRAAALLRLSAEQVESLLARALQRGLARRSTTQAIPHVTIDEKSLHRGQQYVSILCDGTQGAVLEVVENRTTEAAKTLFEQGLSPAQRATVEAVSLDMWEPFKQAAQARTPQAAYVYDHFHISSYLNDAVDQTRRAENKRLRKQDDTTLTGTRYLWLRNPATLDETGAARLARLTTGELQTAAIWRFKEEFRSFFACRTVTAAQTFFQDWCERVKTFGNAPLQKVAQMLERHWDGLVAYVEHPVTNALAESLNTQIQLLKAKARGFRHAPGFRRTILFHLGQLDLYPQ